MQTFKKAFIENVEAKFAIDFEESTPYQRYVTLGKMVRYKIAADWERTRKLTSEKKLKRVYYFSMEFLMGRMITNNLMNAGVYDTVKKAFDEADAIIRGINVVASFVKAKTQYSYEDWERTTNF